MTATDELRLMLDERGVEYRTYDRNSSDTVTWFDLPDGREVSFEEFDSNTTLFKVWRATPEQAIAATLGVGTCKDDGDPSDFCCSECGVRMFTDTNDTYTMIARDGRTIIKRPNYCPNCGKKVVE